MLALLADIQTEGKDVVLGMLFVGLIIIGVIVLGEVTHYLGERRRSRRT